MNGSCVEPDHCRCHFGFVGRNCSTECRCNRHSDCAGVGARDHCLLCHNHTKVAVRDLQACPRALLAFRLRSGILSLVPSPCQLDAGRRWHSPISGGMKGPWGHLLGLCHSGVPGNSVTVSAGPGRVSTWNSI